MLTTRQTKPSYISVSTLNKTGMPYLKIIVVSGNFLYRVVNDNWSFYLCYIKISRAMLCHRG